MNFATEFARVVDDREAHPAVDLVEWELASAAIIDEVSACIEAVGAKPTQALLDLYSLHNGAFQPWRLEGEHVQPIHDLGKHPNDGTPPGTVNVLPVPQTLWTRSDNPVGAKRPPGSDVPIIHGESS